VNVDSTRKNANREVFESSDMIGLRLRAAKKPPVIPFLEIPPEEIDVEPITLDPIDLSEVEPVAITPLIVPMDDILPYEDDIEEIADIRVATQPAVSPLTTPAAPITAPAAPQKNTPTTKPNSGTLSLFGVGEIDPKARK
jgi:hypothetical protein